MMKRKLIIFVLAAAIHLPAMSQFSNRVLTDETVSSSAFQSTSTLPQTGSSYASQPMLSADGTAQYAESAHLSANAPTGHRRLPPMKPEGPPTPVGDAVLPLLLIAIGYAVLLYRKRRAHAPTPDNL